MAKRKTAFQKNAENLTNTFLWGQQDGTADKGTCYLRSVPRIQMMEEENRLPQFILWPPRICVHTQYCFNFFFLKDSTYETQGRLRITQAFGPMKCVWQVSLAIICI